MKKKKITIPQGKSNSELYDIFGTGFVGEADSVSTEQAEKYRENFESFFLEVKKQADSKKPIS